MICIFIIKGLILLSASLSSIGIVYLYKSYDIHLRKKLMVPIGSSLLLCIGVGLYGINQIRTKVSDNKMKEIKMDCFNSDFENSEQ